MLTEHYAGAFPAWLAPVQVVGIPVADEHVAVPARTSPRSCAREGIRVEVDESDDRMQKKIRNAQQQKVPFMLIAGDEDAGPARCRSATATARRRTASRSTRRSPRSSRRASRDRVAGADAGVERVGSDALRAAVDAAPDGLHPAARASRHDGEAGDGCPFCRVPDAARRGRPGRRARGASVYAVLNLYPYNPGHLMVCRTGTSPTTPT